MNQFYATAMPVSTVPNPQDWIPSEVRHPVLAPDYIARLVDEALAQRALALTNQLLPPRSA